MNTERKNMKLNTIVLNLYAQLLYWGTFFINCAINGIFNNFFFPFTPDPSPFFTEIITSDCHERNSNVKNLNAMVRRDIIIQYNYERK